MPVNGQSVGKDYTLVYYDPNTGAIVNFGDVQNVKISAQKHDIVSRPYNSTPKFGFIPDGYKLTFTVVRTGPQLENWALAANAAFEAGSPVIAGYLNETINESDGSVSRYQYTGLVVYLTEVAEITREANIKMSCEAYASDKVVLS